MSPKELLMQQIETGLEQQIITREDLVSILDQKAVTPVVSNPAVATVQAEKPAKKLNAIDLLFYLAGIIFYAALMVMTYQASSNAPILRVLITLGTGLLLWTLTYIIGKQPVQTDIKCGLVNSLLLTGCLALSSGSFITVSEVVDSQATATVLYAVAITLLLLGIFHALFDYIFRHTILVTLSVLFLSATFPSLAVAALHGTLVPPDVWSLIAIASGLLLGYGGRVASRTAPDRAHLKDSFASLAGFVVLGSIYVATLLGDAAPFWEVLLPLTIYLAFYISIKQKSKQFLTTGSTFLVLFLVTVSFKYFSGLGAAFCLVFSALSLLATAFLASNINKRYIKQTSAHS